VKSPESKRVELTNFLAFAVNKMVHLASSFDFQSAINNIFEPQTLEALIIVIANHLFLVILVVIIPEI
jgi:hypothetical protein